MGRKTNIIEAFMGRGVLDQARAEMDALKKQPTDCPSVCPPVRRMDSPMDSPTDTPMDGRTDEQTNGHADGHTGGHTGGVLSPAQRTVARYLSATPMPVSLRGIAKKTGIAYGTVRHALRQLVERGIISRPARVHDGCFQGFSVKVARGELVARLGYTDGQTGGQTKEQSDGQTDGRTDRWTDPPNKVVGRYIENLPTSRARDGHTDGQTGGHTDGQAAVFDSDPEMGFWQAAGLKWRQVASWCDEFGLPAADVIESLAHAGFDLAQKQGIKDPVAVFYSRLKKYGHWLRPAGYVSRAEAAVAREQERARQLAQQAAALAAAREAAARAEADLAFEQMMADPDGPLYGQCLAKVSPLVRRLKGPGFAAGMRAVFDGLDGAGIRSKKPLGDQHAQTAQGHEKKRAQHDEHPGQDQG